MFFDDNICLKKPNKCNCKISPILTNCLSVFGHFVGLELKGLRYVGNTNSKGNFPRTFWKTVKNRSLN